MDFVFCLELIGTIAFAISGALVAIDKKMDILGVAILGMTTAVGGGIVRDIILGNFPPAAFQNPFNALLAIAVSLIIFFPFVRRVFGFRKTRKGILLMDAIGLAVFTMLGLRAGFRYDNFFLAVFVGVVTGVGGGVMRDVFAGERPQIFTKYFYASAAIIGANIAGLLWSVNHIAAMTTGVVVIVVLRLLAAKFHWSLPHAK
ncbi:TRIC cation channel family protein [Candidatus Saccharibacteria bacterium]|nr:TRIC cation channel family protein [Candidatus Saccharibacteria bacterium]